MSEPSIRKNQLSFQDVRTLTRFMDGIASGPEQGMLTVSQLVDRVNKSAILETPLNEGHVIRTLKEDSGCKLILADRPNGHADTAGMARLTQLVLHLYDKLKVPLPGNDVKPPGGLFQ